MGALDLLLLGLVAAGVLFAVRALRRGHSGGCSGDCTRCQRRDCGKAQKND